MTSLTTGIITRQLVEPLPTQVGGSKLTKREREVLALVACGYTNKQIAGALYVSEKTARNHISLCWLLCFIACFCQQVIARAIMK